MLCPTGDLSLLSTECGVQFDLLTFNKVQLIRLTAVCAWFATFVLLISVP